MLRKISHDAWIAIGLLAILVILTAAAAVRETSDPALPALSTESSAPNGGRALWLWLDGAGYRVQDHVAAQFEIPEETAVVMLLDPLAFPAIADEEWAAIDEWVKDGGTLILAGDGIGTRFAAEHYQVNLRFHDDAVEIMTAGSPLLQYPPLSEPVKTRTFTYLASERADFLPLLIAGDQPVAALLREGGGQIFISATGVPFSNQGLGVAGNAEIVLNLFAGVSEGQTIWFDEWHHGKRLAEEGELLGPGNWLRFTPAGHALLFVAGVLFLGIVLSGKSFGRPVPVAKTTLRRAPLEYVSAIANLSRRAGHKRATLDHYHDQIKRYFGKRYRLDPSLKDSDFMDALADFAPHLDLNTIGSLLKRLQNSKISENELVQLAQEATKIIEE